MRRIKTRSSSFHAVLLIAVALIAISAVTTPAFCQKLGTNWRVYNYEPSTNFLWDINKPQASQDGLLQFPIQPFLSTTTGSFVVYLYNNYNYDLTDSTLTADASWTPGTYKTRSAPTCGTTGSTDCGAYVRFEFQDVTSGPYSQSDYWWSTGTTTGTSLDLNASTSGNLNASLNDRTLWSNLCGRLATDTATGYTDCITGAIVTVSAYDAFTNAVKQVKQVGLAFGSAIRYASGVAIQGGTPGTFDLKDYKITAPSI
ncbi:MAG TPA: hypothetical protein VMW54_00020 [Terriglobia bacterium]|nr:hypothetical protein [Terriglobia bacterium]